jgi:DNA polymerase-3 subunit alpha
MKFTHLNIHSHYSLLNALPKLEDLVKKAKDYGIKTLALTDNGNLYGAIEFFKECKKKEIKPIIGVDFYLAPRTRFLKDGNIDKPKEKVILIAKDEVGYKNLIKLVTLAHIDGFYYKPRLDKEVLEKYKEGLVCILPMQNGEVSKPLFDNNPEKSKEVISFYKKTFGDDLYQQITIHEEIKDFNKKIDKILDFSKQNGIKIVAGQEVYYLEKDDRKAWKTLLSIQSNGEIREDDEEINLSFVNPEEMDKLFEKKGLQEALSNCEEIVSKCNLEIELGKWVFPAFTIESGLNPDEELKRIAYNGFKSHNLEQTEDLVKRLDYELEVIKNKGYSPYFLVVADLLKYAKENGILTNIRGSVSGSLTTYLSGITKINPIEYEIPFERFLNPDRPSAPDIDMDYADNRRDEMVEYAKQKYGHDRVAQIGTFGTMAARGSVRDTARALGFPYSLGDMIAKLIPMGSQGFPMTIERALEETEELKKLYKDDKDVKVIIDMAKKIEGCARHMGIHAAGVVISPTEITDYTALQYDPKGEGKIITQYDMYSIEEAGLLKFDFLGLSNLSVIADTLELIEKIRGVKIEQDNIPIDDKKTFKMLQRGETEDLFQLNGDGMTRFLVDLKPTTIHDINAMVALYRPGPLQFIPLYIEGKHNQEKVKYFDPALKPILEKTYGVLVYQDDLLMMAHKLAGYSWGEVDKFRKAVGKKIPEEMAKQKDNFINGCVTHSGWPKKKAEELWKWIEPFAAYGFNKAHSVSYGLIAYHTAYLKANFPAEYMASVLTHHNGEIEKVAISVGECKRMGILILPPDINESFSDFTVVKDAEIPTIRFGLTTIKNFGEGISHSIIQERKTNGKFDSLEDFLKRITDKNLNKKSVEALVKAGALDSLNPNKENLKWRHNLLFNIDNLLKFSQESKKDSNQNSLFGETEVNKLQLEESKDFNKANELLWEKELLGLYISGHPLSQFQERLSKRDIDIKKVKETKKEKSEVILGGIIEDIKEIETKKGDKMLFLKLSDMSDSIDLVVFPKIMEEFKDLINKDLCVVVKGKVSVRNNEKSILVDKIKLLE